MAPQTRCSAGDSVLAAGAMCLASSFTLPGCGNKKLLVKSFAITIGVLLLVAVIVLAARPSYRGLRAGRVDENYLQSGDCHSCHAAPFASWARPVHSRMTQEARPTSV